MDQPPVVSIETPVTGSTFDEGVPVLMQGHVVDEAYADALDTIAAVWAVNGAHVCEGAVVDVGGTTTCSNTFVAGDATISLTVTDPSGQTDIAEADVVVAVNHAPTATLVTPVAGGAYYSDQQIIFAGVATDAEDAAEDLRVEWLDSVDGLLTALDTSPSSDGNVGGTALLTAGEHYVRMTVTDASGRTGEASVALTVNGANTPPSCAIVAPESGAIYVANDTVLFEGTATDPDVPSTSLSATWTSDKDGVLATSTPSSAGDFSFGDNTLSTNTHTITLTVTDDVGAVCNDAILLQVGNPPVVTIEAPSSGDLYNEGARVSFSATVSDGEDAPTEVALSWESSLDGVYSTQGASSSGVSTFTYDGLSPGDHTVTVTATDLDGNTAFDRTTFTINGLPTGPTVGITPDPATSADVLTATVAAAATDPEGDPITYRYAWYRDGVLTGTVTSTLPIADSARGETWEVRVYPSDGYGEGPYGSDAITIGNSAPSLSGVSISPASAQTNDTLTAVVGGWADADGDAAAYTYQWSLDGSVISGATEGALDGSYFARGDTLTVTATPWDGTVTGAPATSAGRVIQNTAPTAPGVTIAPATAADDDDLTCSVLTASSDADGDAVTYSYAWTRNGLPSGIITDTVDASFTADGDTWACVVTPTDGTDTGPSGSATVDVAMVGNPPIVLLDAPTPADIYNAGDRITFAATVSDVEDAPTAVALSWSSSRDGVFSTQRANASGSATFSTTTLSTGDHTVTVTATDPDGNTALDLVSFTINGLPTPPTVVVSPDPARSTDTLTATLTSLSTDPEGDALTYRYAWYQNGALTTNTTSTIAAALTTRGDTWEVRVYPSDGYGEGAYGSDSVGIGNSPPTATGVTISPATAGTDDTLTATASGWSDGDGDPAGWLYQWSLGGTVIVGATDPTLMGTWFSRGDSLTVTATPWDGVEAGTPVVSPPRVIQNTVPTAPVVIIEPASPEDRDTLTCSITTPSTDADGDGVTMSYAWTQNGAPTGLTSSTIDASRTSIGDTWVCSVTASDGMGSGPAGTAVANVAMVGHAPVVVIDAPTPADVYNVGDRVTFAATVSDSEDAPTAVALSWASNRDGVFSTQGANASGAATFTTAGLSTGDHTVTVTGTDTDGNAAIDVVSFTINGLPNAPTVDITPSAPRSTELLTARILTGSSDPEGDALSYRYAWYQNGVLTSQTSGSISAALTTRGETWEVRVYPSDGYGEGPHGSYTVTIGNSVPSATAVSISPTTAWTNDTLTAVVTGWSDGDGDAAGYRYQWYKGGVAIGGATDATLSGTLFAHYDSITVSATPWDGYDTGTTVTSGSRVIENTAPTPPVVAIVPERPEDGSDLACTLVSASTDADGDAISYTYAWTNNGSPSAVTSSTVAAAYTSNGQTWACTVTPSDGAVSGGSGSDSALVGDYTAPPAPVLAALAPYRNETTATVTGTAEALNTITLYIVSSSGTSTMVTTANASGAFTFNVTGLLPMDIYTFYAIAQDAAGNLSGASNTVGTEACDPVDDYEDASTYGDSSANPVIDWATLADNGATTITITGNLLDAADSDWYLIQTSDLVTTGINYYRFHVTLTHGGGSYAFVVYDGSAAAADLDCPTGSTSDPEGAGYTEYQQYAYDSNDSGHGVPADRRYCNYGSSPYYNNCDDLSSNYYIHVVHTAPSYSCEYYELTITNGVW